MSNTLHPTETPSSALAPALVSEIVALHGEIIQSARTTLDKAIRIGQLLTEQKATLKHGLWLRWIEDNLPFAERTARNYMTVYCRRGEIGNGCRFELTDAYRLLADGNDKEKSAHVSNNSGENEWYTPPQYIEAALAVMGSIDLDPASCELANRTVKATNFFTKEDDGLNHAWLGNVWLNPPYAQPLIGQFAEKITAEVELGNAKQACVLVNNATETAWFQRMMERASAVCFPASRIRFIDKEGKPGAPLQGQAVLYFGTSSERFTKEFSQLGIVTDTASNTEPEAERRTEVLQAAASQQGPVTAATIRQVADQHVILNAARAINQEDRQARREARLAEVQETAKLPDAKFRVIYADPPWKYGDQLTEDYGAADHHYALMDLSAICGMAVPAMCEPDAVLFLWVTAPLLPDGLAVMSAWGFTYKTNFVWDKVKHNFGHYSSVRHELLLVGTRGSCVPDSSKLLDSVQSIERTKHSEKPKEFREIVETLYPHGKRLELFARAKAENWDVWGNEAHTQEVAP